MSSKEELQSVAVNFTKYILNNRLIKSRIVGKNELLQLFIKYQVLNPSSVQRSEIIEALQQACLIKRRCTHEFVEDNRYVEFRDQVFRYTNEVAPNFKDLINRRRKLNSKFNELVEDFKSVSLDNNKDEGTSHEDIDGKDKLSKHAELQTLYRCNRKAFVRSIEFLQVGNLNQKILRLGKKEVFVIKIKNTARAALTVHFLGAFNMYNTDDVNLNYKPYSFDRGSSFKIELNVNFTNYGVYLYPIVFEICTSQRPKEIIQFLIEPKFEVLMEEVLDLGPVEPYRFHCKTVDYFPPLKCIPGDSLSSKNAMQSKLGVFNHPIRDSLKRILKCDFKPQAMLPEDELELSTIRKLLCNENQTQVIHNRYGLNCDNYVKRFEFLLWVEEYEIEKEMRLYSQTNVTLKLDLEKNLLKLNIPGLAEGRPSIIKGDKVYVREKNAKVKYEGVVHIVESDSVFLAFNNTFRDNYLYYRLLDVEFSVNTSDVRLCHRALKQIKFRKMVPFMFPTEKKAKLKNADLSSKKTIKETFNEEIKSNPEQMIAINSIVKHSAFPAPYILFGPPGTGKTATIVEAITQIWHCYKRTKKLCVCAPSNSAADLITKRLLQYKIPAREIFRLYALSRSESEIPDDLKICSNYDRIMKEVYFPSKESVKFKTVVVLTPITAGRLVTGGLKGGHFDYLFMDEAGHAIEPEMIVPIIGLLTTFDRKRKQSQVKGSLILAGDPKQLGPVIQSKLAIHIGLDMSLLERLMSQCKIYQKDAETNMYNPAYITKLVNNYRSHKNILHVPNLLFYDNELKVAGKLTRINCAADWIELKKPGFPVIFHSVKGLEERESNSPSYFNQYEIAVISQYLQKLINHKLGGYRVKEEHIGIITPYKKQVQKIRQYLRKSNWTKVTVASVEEFQGQERLIIIISTVRSQIKLVNHDYQFGLGFLKNAKRFNVAVTRAIALLIVIGNPDILQCDPNWRSLIEYCTKNDSYNGPLPSYNVPSDFQPIEKLGLDLSVLTPNADCLPADDQ